ncbi:hypothetical protein DRO59_05235 [Candidatus Bathyarchaeota archaeon]|nr:MAG: hypothetical protein DRO59_05235 [Candidatus Bathyarchaeota archaeon]
MTYTVFLSRQAEKFYRKLKKNVKARVREALTILETKLQNHLYDFRKSQNNLHSSYGSTKNYLSIIII